MRPWRLALVGLAAACGDQRVVVPTTTLDRPAAVAFICADATGQAVAPSECAEEGTGRTLFAVLANSARGELELADVSTPELSPRVRDLDPATPGFQNLWAGALVSDVDISKDGARGVTANFGSCGLGVFDVQPLLDAPASVPTVSRVVPRVDGVELGARPLSAAFVPGSRAHAYVLFPNCGLLARIRLPTGEILEAVRIPASGGPSLVSDPTCPAECQDVGSGCGDGGCPDSARPTHFDVAVDGSVLVVGASGASYLTVVPLLDERGSMGTPAGIPLSEEDDGDAGTGAVRISPNTSYGRFVYAAARDGSVRVVRLAEPSALADSKECETNPDPRDGVLSDELTGCLDPMTTRRRPISEGPGIDLPGRRLPVDIVFAEFTPVDDPATTSTKEDETDGRATFYDGIYAFVLASDGVVSVVNVDDRVYDDAYPHTLRTAINHLDNDTPAECRKGGSCFQLCPRDGEYCVQPPIVGSWRDDSRSPRRPRRSLGSAEVSEDHRYPRLLDRSKENEEDFGVRFSDPLRTPRQDDITLRYEGVLLGPVRAGGLFKPCEEGGSAVCLYDPGAAFCAKGVEAGDIVRIAGCGSDSDCRADIEVCRQDTLAPTEDSGLCVCAEGVDPKDDRCLRTDGACASSPREFVIASASSDRLELVDGPEAGCLRWIVPYSVRAGDALVLDSSVRGYEHRIIADADGVCVPDPDRSALIQSKIALEPPPCVDATIPDPNPCMSRGLVRHGHYLYDLTLENTLDRPPRDRDQEFVIAFSVEGPFSALELDALSFVPAAVELGPDKNVYVVDSGDEIRGTDRGRLLRMIPGEHRVEFLVR